MFETEIRIGDQEAHEKLTARLLWKKTVNNGYNDAGNVKEYADATTRSLVTRSRSTGGARHVNAEVPDVCHESYTFLLDERVPEQEELIKLATRQTDQTQSMTEAATATLTDVERGKWHTIGAYNLANLAAVGSLAGALVEGTDYEVDLPNGRLKVLTGGGVADDEDIVLTFDQPALTFEKYLSQQDVLFYVDVVIEEFNQNHDMFLRRLSGRGYLNVTEWPNQTGEFGTYRVKFTPSAAMTVLKRAQAAEVSDHVEDSEAAGASSSSSSVSSSSS